MKIGSSKGMEGSKLEAQLWEAKLKAEGLPSEILTEQEKAKEAGVELVPVDMASTEAVALTKKLQEEDPRNIFGGFPNTIQNMVSLVENLKEESLQKNIPANEIHVSIHSSCINGSDCVVVSYKDGRAYHYNTKHISGYTREKMIARLGAENAPTVLS